jgi:hypothetical protein
MPANTTGWLALTVDQAAKYKLDGVSITESKLAKAATRYGGSGFELAPGSYSFEVGL